MHEKPKSDGGERRNRFGNALFKVYFLRKNYCVSVAETFEDAYAVLNAFDPDIVFIAVSNFNLQVVLENILRLAPNVQTIVAHGEVVYGQPV